VRACSSTSAGWHAGRFLERWADPRWLARLPDAIAPYDERGTTAAIAAICNLFADVCAAIERRAGIAAPVDIGAVRRRLDAIL
jgi:aminoglycoside 6-adenylyltransferase